MHADGRVDLFVAIRDAHRAFDIGWAVAGANRHHALDTCCERALDDGPQIVGEALAIEMAVRVDHLLLESRADGHVFNESSKRRAAAFERCGDDHTLRCESAQLAWSKV